MKVLNLYAGIGGNRKLWTDVEVTAVELNPQIAKIYQDFFPQDKVIVADAHQYLLEHFKEFEFIWSSPPCPSHSRIRLNSAVARGESKPIYPSMELWQEIIFLKHHHKGQYCVENVIAYYEPLYPPQEVSRHYFWANFHIGQFDTKSVDIANVTSSDKVFGVDLSKYGNCGHRKDQILRNQVNPYLGLHILNESKRNIQPELFTTT